jgi:hypothetical protein
MRDRNDLLALMHGEFCCYTSSSAPDEAAPFGKGRNSLIEGSRCPMLGRTSPARFAGGSPLAPAR